MAQIGYHRYEGETLETKYGWMQAGEGTEAAMRGHRGLGRMANTFANSDDALHKTLQGLSVDWQGRTAAATGAALQRAAEWVAGAGAAGRTASGSVERYGGSFAETKPKIQPQEQVGAWTFGDHAKAAAVGTHTVMIDQYQKLAANQARDEEANRALRAHEGATREAVAQFPQLEPPVPMTNAATAGGGGGGGGGIGVATGGAGVVPTASGGAGLPTAGGGGAGTGGVGPGNLPIAPTGGPIPPTGGPVSTVPSPGRGTSIPGGSGAGLGPARPGGLAGGGAGALAGRPGPGGSGGADAHPGARGGAANPASAASRAASGGGFMYPPWAAGGSGGVQDNDREHRNRYAIPSDEAFHPELPIHVPPVLGEP